MTESSDRSFGDIGTSILHENDQIRVWELKLEPGQSSDLHHHQHDYLMVQIEGDKIAAQFEKDSTGTFAGADQLEGPVSPGMAIFAEAGGRETAVNTGTETFREIIVELKDTAEKAAQPTQEGPAIMPLQHVSIVECGIELRWRRPLGRCLRTAIELAESQMIRHQQYC